MNRQTVKKAFTDSIPIMAGYIFIGIGFGMIMGMLCVYCLKDVTFTDMSGWAPSAISVALVVVLQLWKHSSLLSIGAGTVCYMILVQVVLA